MVQITDRANAELRRLVADYVVRPQQGVRLHLNKAGDLGMAIDVPHTGDSIIRRDSVLVLIVDGRLAARLAMRVLDFPDGPGGGGAFTLGWRPSSAFSTSDDGQTWPQ
jgi:Fe-S cluster assembly iron-binding protein IscA